MSSQLLHRAVSLYMEKIMNYKYKNIVVCLLALTALNVCAESTEELAKQSQNPVGKESPKESSKESPWVIAPTMSSDPKLATTVGAIVGYLYQFDEESTKSIFITKANYSTSDS